MCGARNLNAPVRERKTRRAASNRVSNATPSKGACAAGYKNARENVKRRNAQ